MKYQSSDFSKAMFLIEAECLAPPADSTTNTDESSAKEIIFGLGMIVTLILLSVFLLYRSLGVTPVEPEITQLRELSESNTKVTNYL